MNQIVYISYNLNMPGGMEQNTRRFMVHFPEIKYHSFVRGGFRNSKFQFRLHVLLAYLRFIWLLIRTPLKVAHIHYGGRNDLVRGIPYILLSRLFGLRVVVQSRFDINWSLSDWNAPLRAMIRWSLRQANLFVFLTRTLQQSFLNNFPQAASLVIPNPAPPEYVDKTPLPLDARRNAIVFLGRYCAEKGCNELLEAARRHVAEDPTVSYELYGGGSTLHSDHERIRIGRWITGEAKHRVISEARLVVTPSYFEAFGMTNLEALCCGTPVVATRVGGVPDLIHHGEFGLLVEPGNADQLYSAIRKLIDDTSFWKRCSAAAYESARTYDITNILNKWRQVYEELAGTTGRVTASRVPPRSKEQYG